MNKRKVDQVYCEYFIASNGILKVPLKSYLLLFLWKMCKFEQINLIFVKCSMPDVASEVPFLIKFNEINEKNEGAEFVISESTSYPQIIRNTILPAIVCQPDETCITGLCAVIRYILKLNACDGAIEPNFCEKLLGFRKGCLMACAEVSSWTKFCEFDFLRSTQIFIQNTMLSGDVEVSIPLDVYKFEYHLQQPLKIHNVYKRLNGAKLTNRENSHYFAEGIDMMLSDVLLFVCFHLMFAAVGEPFKKSDASLMKVDLWYSRILNLPFIQETIDATFVPVDQISPDKLALKCSLPKKTKSLFISDITRNKPKSCRDEYDSIIKKINKHNFCIDFTDALEESSFVDWDSLPREAHPAGGDLPVSRITRKCEQLDSMIQEVCAIAKPGDVIVDYCSGGGHLGIPLGYLLPKCKIILIENKESSIGRARYRVKSLGLNNILFYQGNLDYYRGKFNIGVSLHACGVATDLVIQKCIEQHASFICCPCCYGFIENTHTVAYPRSNIFKQNDITYENYLLLCHIADQTEKKTTQYEKGRLCMKIIDSDRLLQAKQREYHIKLKMMFPPSCTPKNHLLIGIFNE